jgi:hypothetical protein
MCTKAVHMCTTAVHIRLHIQHGRKLQWRAVPAARHIDSVSGQALYAAHADRSCGLGVQMVSPHTPVHVLR